jgi:hypothetical protein
MTQHWVLLHNHCMGPKWVSLHNHCMGQKWMLLHNHCMGQQFYNIMSDTPENTKQYLMNCASLFDKKYIRLLLNTQSSGELCAVHTDNQIIIVCG